MKIVSVCITLIFSSFLGGQVFAQDIIVKNAIAAPSLTSQSKTGAVYLSIMNMGAKSDELIGMSSTAASSAMLHQSKDENGVMKMEMLDILEIPAGKTVDILPGQMHIMLMELKATLKTGDHVALELEFKNSGKVSVDAIVGKLEDITNMNHTN